MKKLIGIILIGIAVLNIVGLIYLSATNPDKLSNNSSYFGRKVAFGLILGAIGLGLLLTDKKNEE